MDPRQERHSTVQRARTPLSHGTTSQLVDTAWFALTESHHPPSQCVAPHAHLNDDLTVILRGGFETTIARKRLECGPAEVFFLPAGTVHSDRFAVGHTRTLIIEFLDMPFDGDTPFKRSTEDPLVLPIPRCFRWIARLCDALRAPTIEATADLEEAVLELWMSAVSGPTTRVASHRPRWLQDATDLIASEFRNRLSLASVANAIGVHPVHLARVFRAHWGRSVGDFIDECRINSAAKALGSSDLPIAEIALREGFHDQAHLTRFFAKRMGTTPARFRAFHSRL